jgi:hypothetical protein
MTGHMLWEEPSIYHAGHVAPSHDLFATLAFEDGLLVAGQRPTRTG